MSESIGMMEGAYFVSRTELLNWLNSNFSLSYTKVEQCCSAAAHCQVTDAIFPGTVAMDKVVWDAKSEYQYVNNFKVLQKAFDKNGVKRHIDVEKLVKGKYQDNLEFLQWIKAYFDMKKGQLDEDYDPIARRSVAPSAAKMSGGGGGGGGGGTRAPAAAGRRRPAGRALGAGTASKGSAGDKKKLAELEAQISDLEAQAQEDKVNMDNLATERDFYFKKLRDIEVLCQQIGDDKPQCIDDIIEILYATEDGFDAPDAQ